MTMKNMFLAMTSLLGVDTSVTNQAWYKNIVNVIIQWLDALLVPIIIIVATAGMIYAIYLGIQLARAESADKRDEAKKKMLWFILAFVLTILILVIIQLLITNQNAIFDLIDNGLTGSNAATTSSTTPTN